MTGMTGKRGATGMTGSTGPSLLVFYLNSGDVAFTSSNILGDYINLGFSSAIEDEGKFATPIDGKFMRIKVRVTETPDLDGVADVFVQKYSITLRTGTDAKLTSPGFNMLPSGLTCDIIELSKSCIFDFPAGVPVTFDPTMGNDLWSIQILETGANDIPTMNIHQSSRITVSVTFDPGT